MAWVTAPALCRPFTIEAGFQLESFSESYGAGDLFSDLEETPGQDPTVGDDEIRVRSDLTSPGGYASIEWLPEKGIERRVELEVVHEEATTATSLDGTYLIHVGRQWKLTGDERLRLQWGHLEEDHSRDLLQSLEVEAERPIQGLGTLELALSQEFSRVSGDSLSRLYDYTLHEVGVSLARPLLGSTARWRTDWTYRDSPAGYSGNSHRLRAGMDLYRYGLTGWSFDLSTLLSRRLHDESGVVAPSNVEGELTANARRDVSGALALTLDGEYRRVVFDEPDETYFDYLTGRAEIGGAWNAPAGMTVEIAGGGEWLRPQSGDSGAYDQSRLSLKVGYLGAGSLWADIEEAVGHRNYLGPSSTSGVLTDAGSLNFESSDFVYSELSGLVGYTLGIAVLDVYGQYTVEQHEDEAEDVSFFLFNLRLGVRY